MGRDYADTHANRKSTGSRPADALTARREAPRIGQPGGAPSYAPAAADVSGAVAATARLVVLTFDVDP
jgi:hypothetical protein